MKRPGGYVCRRSDLLDVGFCRVPVELRVTTLVDVGDFDCVLVQVVVERALEGREPHLDSGIERESWLPVVLEVLYDLRPPLADGASMWDW